MLEYDVGQKMRLVARVAAMDSGVVTVETDDLEAVGVVYRGVRGTIWRR